MDGAADVGVVPPGRGQVPGQLRQPHTEHQHQQEGEEIRQGGGGSGIRGGDREGQQDGRGGSRVTDPLHQDGGEAQGAVA